MSEPAPEPPVDPPADNPTGLPDLVQIRVAICVNDDDTISLVSCKDPHDYELQFPGALTGMTITATAPPTDA